MMNEDGSHAKGNGYRGYIGSRVYHCGEFPQYVQNMIIRNYCQKHHLTYLLSATEYAMPGCYMILEEVVNTIETVQGIAMFSIFMLPTSAKKRHKIYQKILKKGKSLHAALEDIAIKSEADIQMVEDILRLNQITQKGSALTSATA
jgi:sporadic carbohydrate cluster protein (TIGR04323 family)